jgi:cytochrome c biogenesis protein CcmG, thiol:disulfide interchange protein DsbE
MRAPFVAAGALMLALALASLGCGAQESTLPAPTPAEARRELAGSPPPLDALHRQAAELLDGGPPAFRARLAELRGRPVVVNAWASWCGPCRVEMPFFQRAAVRFGRRVAFLGIDVDDPDKADARAFLRRYWAADPSYADPDEEIARAIGVRAGLPTTVFYGRDGEVAFVHQGQYRDEQDLRADIERYAGRSS